MLSSLRYLSLLPVLLSVVNAAITERAVKSDNESSIFTISSGTTGKTPVVFIHGMAMSVAAWTRLIDNAALTKDYHLASLLSYLLSCTTC